MKLSTTTLARVRGTAAVVAISALTGCGGASALSDTPPTAVDPPRVAQVSAPVEPPVAQTDNTAPSSVVPQEDYPVDCGRG